MLPELLRHCLISYPVRAPVLAIWTPPSPFQDRQNPQSWPGLVDPTTLCSMCYTTVDEVATLAAQCGKGTLLAKVDTESAYRLLPVHPQDRPLQAMEWEGQIYIDSQLPFGLRSAPKIYNALADALQWILRSAGVDLFHTKDDILIFGAPATPQCGRALQSTLEMCVGPGVPIAAHKTEGPASVLTFLY